MSGALHREAQRCQRPATRAPFAERSGDHWALRERARGHGTWIYYRLADQEHDAVEMMLGTLTKSFGAEKTLRADHAKLRKSCGPNACK